MAEALDAGMSLRITYWGSEAKVMKWLDGKRCDDAACTSANAGDATISNIAIRPLTAAEEPWPAETTEKPTESPLEAEVRTWSPLEAEVPTWTDPEFLGLSPPTPEMRFLMRGNRSPPSDNSSSS